MFGFSLSELLIIIIISLIFLKPKDIIKIFQKIHSYYEKLKYELDDAKSKIILLEEDKFINEEVVDEFSNSKQDVKKLKNKNFKKSYKSKK